MRKNKIKEVIAGLFILLFVLFVAVGCQSCLSVSNDDQERDENGWTRSDKVHFAVIVDGESSNYVSNFKSPITDEWTFIKYDEEKVLATAKYEFKNSNIKQEVISVFTYNGEHETYRIHYLSIGNIIFVDDGECSL